MGPSPARSQPHRRRRSVRVTVAVLLLVLAAAGVVLATATGPPLAVAGAGALAVVLGAAATRITHAEVTRTRLAAARDRAEQARAYRELTVAREADHDEVVAHLARRLSVSERAVGELADGLVAAQRRAAVASRRLRAESRRADLAEHDACTLAVAVEEADARAAEAGLHLAELEVEVAGLCAELDVLRADVRRTDPTLSLAPLRRHA